MATSKKALDRRSYPRLQAAFGVRLGVCGRHEREIPGFTNNLSVGGFCFTSPSTTAKVGDHISAEISLPGYDEPLYFLGEVVRVSEDAAGYEIACRFDWLGKSDHYIEKLEALLAAHSE